MSRLGRFLAPVALLLAALPAAAQAPGRDGVRGALLKAVRFYHKDVSRHGGYVWAYSGDLRLREGEGAVGDDTIWVQPPGTPAVGEAFLDAYEATGETACLDAARDAAQALVNGQLQSGGWNYRIEFEPQKRREWSYVADGAKPPGPPGVAAGWEEWKRRKHKGNLTVLDDDTTQAATRFLVRFDRTTGLRDGKVHAAVLRALDSLLNAQYPNGGWSASYDHFPTAPPPVEQYPVTRARYPEDWPRIWPKDFTGCYVTNDNLMADAIDTMLLAAEVYRDTRYESSARRAGDFLLRAQMPEPQPAWAQQYDQAMTPVWSRAFEPPAVTGGESQGILEALLRLHRATGDEKYLEPIPRAIAYLKRSRRPDGRLARFYELKTNRPLYFERDGQRKHRPTYDDGKLASGYAYVVNSRLDRIEAEYARARDGKPPRAGTVSPNGTERARAVISAMDARGAWVSRGRLRHHGVEPESGLIDGRTFVRNVKVLCDALRAQ
jgi:hypothetical protein